MLKNIKINCPLNTVQIDVLRIKPTVLYDTNSVIRKHFSTNFTVQHKPSQAKLGELCPPPGPRPFNSYSIDCLAIYYFSIQIINLISKIEHTAIEGVQGRLWAQQNDLRSLLIRRITCKSLKVNKTETASGDQNARCGDKMAEARRCGKRHGDGFPSRSFCVSGSSRGHFFKAQGGSDLPPSYCSQITHWLKIQFWSLFMCIFRNKTIGCSDKKSVKSTLCTS